MKKRNSKHNAAEGLQRKEHGMAVVDAAEGGEWKARTTAAIEEFAASGDEFTALEIRDIVGDPVHPNAFGARFNAAARAGIIRKVGYRNSSRPTLHAHPIAVWVGASRWLR